MYIPYHIQRRKATSRSYSLSLRGEKPLPIGERAVWRVRVVLYGRPLSS